MAKKTGINAAESTTNGNGKKVQPRPRLRLSSEEKKGIRVKLAEDPRAFVLICDAPLSYSMSRVLNLFNRAYAQFKLSLGETGGLSHEEADQLMAEGREIVLRFNDFTDKLHRKVNWRYKQPYEVEDLRKCA